MVKDCGNNRELCMKLGFKEVIKQYFKVDFTRFL